MVSKVLLEVSDAKASFDESYLPSCAFNLKLRPGECIVIESRSVEATIAFADLCTGMVPLRQGKVSFRGLDWTSLRDRRLAALRGRIGRVFQKGGWVDIYPIAVNILLPMLHHTTINVDELTAQALSLCHNFGLPGLPMDTPRHGAPIDLARAGCVRAFLGWPELLLLEYPFEEYSAELMAPFFEALISAQNRGAGVVCFTRNLSLWSNYKKRVTQWMRLQDKGLTSVRFMQNV